MITDGTSRPTTKGQDTHPAAASDFSRPPRVGVNLVEAQSDSSTDTLPAVSEFARHEKRWKRDTQYVSDPAVKYLHPSYARIIGLGPIAVTLILQSMRREPADWFYALRALTGENPVTPSMAGDVARMTEAWLQWADDKSVG